MNQINRAEWKSYLQTLVQEWAEHKDLIVKPEHPQPAGTVQVVLQQESPESSAAPVMKMPELKKPVAEMILNDGSVPLYCRAVLYPLHADLSGRLEQLVAILTADEDGRDALEECGIFSEEALDALLDVVDELPAMKSVGILALPTQIPIQKRLYMMLDMDESAGLPAYSSGVTDQLLALGRCMNAAMKSPDCDDVPFEEFYVI